MARNKKAAIKKKAHPKGIDDLEKKRKHELEEMIHTGATFLAQNDRIQGETVLKEVIEIAKARNFREIMNLAQEVIKSGSSALKMLKKLPQTNIEEKMKKFTSPPPPFTNRSPPPILEKVMQDETCINCSAPMSSSDFFCPSCGSLRNG